MIFKDICRMRGITVDRIAIVICLVVVGWMACLLFEDWSFFSIDRSISVADVLSILVDVALAVFIARVIDKSIQESRVEKDFFISDLSRVEEIFTELDKTCSSSNTTISFSFVVESISRAKRILNKCWKLLGLYDEAFTKGKKDIYDSVIQSIREVDQRLTEPNFYDSKKGFEPVKIVRRKIYLNSTVKADIEDSISQVKSNIFQLKVAINKK